MTEGDVTDKTKEEAALYIKLGESYLELYKPILALQFFTIANEKAEQIQDKDLQARSKLGLTGASLAFKDGDTAAALYQSYEDLTLGFPVRKQEIKETQSRRAKLATYIPIETVLAFVAISAYASSISLAMYWFVFLALLALTAIYVYFVSPHGGIRPTSIQIAVSTAAFFTFVFVLGGPFVYCNWYSPILGTVLLIFFGVALSIVERNELLGF
jgi:hypothetical protein